MNAFDLQPAPDRDDQAGDRLVAPAPSQKEVNTRYGGCNCDHNEYGLRRGILDLRGQQGDEKRDEDGQTGNREIQVERVRAPFFELTEFVVGYLVDRETLIPRTDDDRLEFLTYEACAGVNPS